MFLACLALGVAAIAAVGTLRAGIEQGLTDQGAVMLGGDAEMQFTYRSADEGERACMASIATRVSEVFDFRSMAVIEGDQALTQVKAVDDGYPLTGAATLDPAIPVAEALGDQNGLPGAVMDPVLIDRLGLAIGDTFRLGTQEFRLCRRAAARAGLGLDRLCAWAPHDGPDRRAGELRPAGRRVAV